MSYCKEEGKDRIFFVTKEDQDEPIHTATVKDLESQDEEEGEGLILPNGDINWNCPCLGGMASGPCGVEFREAFSCFHYSEAEPKGSDCLDNFRTMQECMVQYPDLYPVGEDKEKEMIEEAEEGSLEEQEEEGIHHIKETVADSAAQASAESAKETVADKSSSTEAPSEENGETAVATKDDAVVIETTRALSENGEDSAALTEDGKS